MSDGAVIVYLLAVACGYPIVFYGLKALDSYFFSRALRRALDIAERAKSESLPNQHRPE
jgi:hypothetical protein